MGNSTTISKNIDYLIANGYSFAIYRLPHESKSICILQREKKVFTYQSIIEIENKQGFIVSPFCPQEEYPIVLIKNDFILNIDEIEHIDHYVDIDKDIKLEQSINQSNTKTDNLEDAFIEYSKSFNIFLDALNRGDFHKLVLSRRYREIYNSELSIYDIYQKAFDADENVMVALWYSPITGIWITCTPEIILRKNGTEWQTVSLAGTVFTPTNQDVVWSKKNKEEQSLVTGYIVDILQHHNLRYFIDKPQTIQAGKLSHLKTNFYFHYPTGKTPLQLLSKLYPTPAICGLPKQESQEFITKHEGYERGYYSGIIGPFNINNCTDFYINLRCASINQDMVTYYAGGGLLSKSDLKTEWEETENKMNTLRNLLHKK